MTSTSEALRVVPRPRQVDERNGRVRLDEPFSIAGRGTAPDRTVELLAELLERETNAAVVRSTANADVSLAIREEPSERFDDPDGYVLDAMDGTIAVRAENVDGLRHGCQTLVGGIESDGDGWLFPSCEVHDWPATRWRGFMADPARGFLSVDRLKRRIDQAARAKLNRFHLHLFDHESYALESEAYPELNRGPDGEKRPSYSPADVAELVDYADRRGVEVVPEIDVPSHAGWALECYPTLRCSVDGEPSDRTMCIGAEATDDFVEGLIDEVVEQFPFDRVHVGGDEWAMGNSWDECSVCARRMAADGSASLTEHFYAFLRRVDDLLDDRDRRPIYWNDQIDSSESPDLPSDALIQFWRVAGEGRGPVEGCRLDRFLEEGFEVVNSYVYAAYINAWVTEAYLLGWAPRRRPSVPDERADQVIGGELLAWEPSDEAARDYYERALPSAIPAFADRLWNPSPVADRPSFSRALTRHALGPFVPDGFDVYRELGGTILPTMSEDDSSAPPARANRSLGDRTPPEAVAAYESAIETLATLTATNETIYPETNEAYRECLEWLVGVAEREGRGVIDRP